MYSKGITICQENTWHKFGFGLA